MKNLTKVIIAVTALVAIGTTSVAFATGFRTPIEVVSGLTGKSAVEISTERETGKTYGEIAKENGKLDEFKVQMLEKKKTDLAQRVKDGIITQEKADQIYSTVKDNQVTCDGTGQGIGKKGGAGFGSGSGRMNGRTGPRDGSGMRFGSSLNR